ncbi:TerD family protein [Pseudomonas sp. KNUC1026]|uniref:TerD family protein n=1 Tax=Pseudomonas sp. KNUC1026 TaxID=2893890 RepID=UPI001F233BC0|nr:TerD family protein [Pseudomonas sp. KNUC1026]UFH50801.1 TerD family protein [Pseudomonas sp. KNUC1026]
MTALLPGGNASVASERVQVQIAYSPIPGADIDVSAFVLAADGKVRSDADMCFYGQPQVLCGAVRLAQASVGEAIFELDLGRLDTSVEKVSLAATIHQNKASFGAVSSLSLEMTGGLEARLPTSGMSETALILGEFYRRQGQWKFRCIAQGFAGGLAPLSTHFGVDIIESAPAATPPKPVLSLSKITLDKHRASISLEKTAAGFGQIRVNLNWNQRKKGLFGGLRQVDLDVGCLYELQDGQKGVVQALGNSFGDLERAPFMQLMGDDRTGSVQGGEWIHINGQRWAEIRRILVFAFIYKGAPNWRETDGVVTLFIPGQPEIEVRLNEEGGRLGCCAIALLENDNGAVKVTRRVDFHASQAPMDKAYGWGMRWTTGSK